MSFTQLALAFAGALVAAAINSVAGGGTLVSFPILVALGLPPLVANATSTAGIWPGSLGSLWGFRAELARTPRRLTALSLPALLGGAVGAGLLRVSSAATFERLVPFLVLFATLLFAVRGRVTAWLSRADATQRPLALGVGLIFSVGIYGGYFGAGLSIMNLSVLGLLGLTDLLEMNALTSLYSLCVNGTAIALFAAAGLIRWDVALAMALGALVGGYGAVGLARRVGKQTLGRVVVTVGFVVSALFFARAFVG